MAVVDMVVVAADMVVVAADMAEVAAADMVAIMAEVAVVDMVAVVETTEHKVIGSSQKKAVSNYYYTYPLIFSDLHPTDSLVSVSR